MADRPREYQVFADSDLALFLADLVELGGFVREAPFVSASWLMPGGSVRSCAPTTVPAMADAEKVQKCYESWRQAEATYAEVLAAFGGDEPPAKVRKSAAIELATARSAADKARDKFFKLALK